MFSSSATVNTHISAVPADNNAREYELLAHVLSNASKGSIESVLTTIDTYCWNGHWHMNLGDVKGKITDQQLFKRNPHLVLELGTYVGYSSLRMIRNLPSGSVVLSIELNPIMSEIALQIHAHAGVTSIAINTTTETQISIAEANICNSTSRIYRLIGDSNAVIPTLKARFPTLMQFGIDFIFIDHWKDVYLRDFKLLESTEGLIVSNTMIVADNVIYPGAPDYLEYVRNNNNYRNETIESLVEYTTDKVDAVQISIRK